MTPEVTPRANTAFEIHNRATTSRRVQKTLLGLGIVFGITAGVDQLTGNNLGLTPEVALVSTVGVGALGPTERFFARRRNELNVRRYEEVAGADFGSRKQFVDTTSSGTRTMSDSSIFSLETLEKLVPVAPPVLASTGMSHLVHAVAEGFPQAPTTSSILLVGSAVAFAVLDGITHERWTGSLRRQMNNVDRNVDLKGKPDGSSSS